MSHAACGWYIFYHLEKVCILLEDCDSLQNECSNCTSGEKACGGNGQLEDTNLVYIDTDTGEVHAG